MTSTAVSALACLATIALWIRSETYTERLEGPVTRDSDVELAAQQGCMAIEVGVLVFSSEEERHGFYPVRWRRSHVYYLADDVIYGHNSAGFGWSRRDGTWWQRTIVVPFWFVTTILLLAACFCWRKMARRHAMGCCTRCGYDLRATPERCPECGAIPAAPVS
jgi:hypothetical protein